jgi:hypothetical protein
MSAFAEDFKIDGICGASGEFSPLFLQNCIGDGDIAVNQTYKARQFLKFVNEVYKRHKNDYGKKSSIDMTMQFVTHPKVGPIFVVKVGEATYGLCPSRSDVE